MRKLDLGKISHAASLVLYRYFQRLMLGIPVLSEMRLASDKVMAFLRIWHYLARARVSGDYLEFGVFQGMSFELSLTAAGKFYPVGSPASPRFFAFDSFSGLPGLDDVKDDADVWHEGEYSASLALFKKHIAVAAKGRDVSIVPGFYEKSLTPDLRTKHRLTDIAFVNIDCDLYSSTLEALNFCTPMLKTGSIIFFDDWYASKGDLKLGEARACEEWLAANPQFRLIDFGDVAIMGKAFLVNRIDPPATS